MFDRRKFDGAIATCIVDRSGSRRDPGIGFRARSNKAQQVPQSAGLHDAVHLLDEHALSAPHTNGR
jgi:hypothetical protein